MTSNTSDDDALAPVRFLSDAAADTDFFGSHQRVAEGIAAAIHDNACLKVVGILGPWGSGKSSVVGFVEKALVKSSTGYRLFAYDAWLHQSDPPRRAFLERFLAFLTANQLVVPAEWEEPMDKLNRRIEDSKVTTTPLLTKAGYWLLLSLVVVPIGTRFVGADWYTKMIGTGAWPEKIGFPIGLILSLSPILVALIVYYAWRPKRWIFSRAWFAKSNWTTHRHPHQKDSVLALIVNKQVSSQESRLVRTPEPTTIEFQTVFRDMLKAAHRENERLVIVVDNLDRLPETEAIDMWTTIRSFFLGALAPDEKVDQSAMPTVLLPIDDHAVARLYSEDAKNGETSLAQSFMDKTFDITFHVATPVLSGWNEYLRDRMKHVFGEQLAEEWAFDVGRMYAKCGRMRVTPRDLNRQVNAIASLWLQWRGRSIPFPVIAYYAIFRREFDNDLVNALQQPKIDLSEHDPNAQRSLAAIHFGVPPEHALEILLKPEIVKAIDDGDRAAFDRHLGIRGLAQTVISMIDDKELDYGQLANLAELIDQAQGEPIAETSRIWHKLSRAFIGVKWQWDQSPGHFPAILLHRASEADRTRVLKAITQAIGDFRLPQVLPGEPVQNFCALLKIWFDHSKMLDDPVSLSIKDAGLYLQAAAPLLNGEPNDLIGTNASGNSLINNLAVRFAESGAGATLPQIDLALAHGGSDKARQALLEAADEVLNDQNEEEHRDAALHAIGCLAPGFEPAAIRLQQFADSGALLNWITATFDGSDPASAARLAALMIVADKSPPTPPDGGWNALVKRWPNFVAAVEAALMRYSGGKFIERIAHLHSKHESIRELLAPLIRGRIDEGDIGVFDVEAILADRDSYWTMIPISLEAAFYSLVITGEDQWEILKAQNLDNASIRIFRPLLEAEDESIRKRARDELRAGLFVLDKDRWVNALTDGEGLIGLAVKLQQLDGAPLAIGKALFEALRDHVPGVTDTYDEAACKDWFAAATLLSPSGHSTMLRNLRDRINLLDRVPNLLRLLKAGDVALLSDAGFQSRADESVRHVLIPLVDDDEGILWMTERMEILGDWVKKANETTRNFLAERLTERRAEAEATRGEHLDRLLGGWELNGH